MIAARFMTIDVVMLVLCTGIPAHSHSSCFCNGGA